MNELMYNEMLGEARKEQKINHCYTRFCRNKN